MAEKKLERNYIIPLRKKISKTARWKRAKKSVSEIKSFIKKHMKCENVKIGKELNELIWERGGKKVPSKVNVFAVKEEDVTKVNLAGIEEKKEEKKDKKKEEKPKEVKEEKKKEEPKKEPKKEEVKEKKEEKSDKK